VGQAFVFLFLELVILGAEAFKVEGEVAEVGLVAG